MPLEHGSSRAVMSHNIKEMVEAGHPQKQAVAAAYREAGEGRKDEAPDTNLMSKLDAIVAGCDRLDARIDAHVGFEKLKNELAHKKGVSDPAAVAAAIGRKKLGQAEMTRRSVAGREK